MKQILFEHVPEMLKYLLKYMMLEYLMRNTAMLGYLLDLMANQQQAVAGRLHLE